jgi:hypothetical protein
MIDRATVKFIDNGKIPEPLLFTREFREVPRFRDVFRVNRFYTTDVARRIFPCPRRVIVAGIRLAT